MNDIARQALPVQQLLKDRYIPEITSIEYNGEFVHPPSPIPWFPDQLAWQMTTPKSIVRKFAPFKSFQQFLVSETSVGNISRQEVVSMIPPLLMDVKPGMAVLDMCAAPGSKAAQLIEMVHGGEEARMRKVTRKTKIEEGREVSPDGELTKDETEEQEEVGDWSDDGRTTGLLIANDSDYKRAHMLIHQMKRLNSPNLIVTNHDATMFPSIKLPSESARAGATPRGRYLKFDRILADVPCSGDGTCRKNVNVWKDWIPGNALGLYSTQVRILVRALQMLKVGGRVVYSTCSMSPVENEAVIATAIARCGGMSKVDIIDCSSALPQLKRRKGLTGWKVMDKKGKIWSSWEAVEEERARNGEDGLGRLTEAMFPPLRSNDTVPLERCMRVYGHLQDTGAFFIAVLEKKTEIKAKPEAEAKQVEPQPSIVSVVNEIEAQPTNDTNPVEKVDALDNVAPPTASTEEEDVSAVARQNRENTPSTGPTAEKRTLDAEADGVLSNKRPKFRDDVDDPAPPGPEDRQIHYPPPPAAQLAARHPSAPTSPLSHLNSHPVKKPKGTYEEPFIYLRPDHPDLHSITTFYALSPRFPTSRFMVRNATGTPAKTIYYTSSLARDILTTNASLGIKFVHCGVKMFVKQDAQSADVCRWRIQSEGMPIVEGWVGEERVVRLWKRSTLRTLLMEMFPKVEGNGWRDLGEIGQRVLNMGMGCCVLRVEKGGGEGEEGFSERMVLPLWRSRSSLNLMLPKEERRAMLLRLFNDDTPLQDHSKDRFLKKTESRVEGVDGEVDEGGAVERNGQDVAGAEDDGEEFAPGGADDDIAVRGKEDLLPDAFRNEELDVNGRS